MEEKKSKRKKIDLKYLPSNSTFAYPLLDKDDNEVVSDHITVSVEKKKKLLEAGYSTLYYYEDSSQKYKSALQKYIDKNSYKGPRAISVDTQTKAVSMMDKLVTTVKDVLLQVKPEDIGELVDAINQDLDHSQAEFINLLDGFNPDDYIYTHSLNVGVISLLFAKAIRLSEELIREIGIGAFLHDIGMTKIPKEILNKNGKLDREEYQKVQEHPQLGYDMIKDNHSISEIAKEIILSHHERYDGGGYPNKIMKDEIKQYVTIVSLADMFDALTSKRPYREPVTTPKALEIILSQQPSFDSVLLKRFVKEVGNVFRESNFYPVGSYVVLNTKEVGKVVGVNDKKDFLRPVIRIISNQHGKKLKIPIKIDLKVDFSRDILHKVEME